MITGNQRGTVLIVTLLVIVIMTITVTEFLYHVWVDRSLAANYRDATRSLYALTSGANAARAVLADDFKQDQKSGTLKDTLGESWAQSAIPVPVDDTFLFATITDESSKIDLNRLITAGGYPDNKWEAAFRALLRNLEIDVEIAVYVRDWIDSNDEGPAESSYYLSLATPYKCKNARFDSPAELPRVRGVTPEVYGKLRKFVTISSSGWININTAPQETLMALNENITENMAQSLIAARTDLPFKSKEEVKNIAGFSDIFPQISNLIDVRSNDFLIEESVTFNEVRRSAQALFTGRNTETARLLFFTVD